MGEGRKMAFILVILLAEGCNPVWPLLAKLEPKNGTRYCSGSNQNWKGNPSEPKNEGNNI